MIDFSHEELVKIAKLSALRLDAQELKELEVQLQKTLTYLEELEQFTATVEHEATHTINVFRDDKPIQTDSAPLLAQAPQTTETYIAVPKILE